MSNILKKSHPKSEIYGYLDSAKAVKDNYTILQVMVIAENYLIIEYLPNEYMYDYFENYHNKISKGAR